MTPWEGVLTGLLVVLKPATLFFCFVGVLMGTMVGSFQVWGGRGHRLASTSNFSAGCHNSPDYALRIYYGAMYGGSTTSILVNVPGEAASVVTCIDGIKWL